jgi:hypothetical protein
MMKTEIRIAGASGFWGDTDAATEQLLAAPDLDYIVYDYLSEITLALLARARAKNPAGGYIPDFERAITPHLAAIKAKGVRLLANAGGLNPVACAQALEAAADRAGVSLRVAAVIGDEVMDRIPDDAADMFSGAALPQPLLSANAYLGAAGIVQALADGADIVVTGRCADSALTLAPLIHGFGWSWTDWDRLAQGSLAGHLIECGSQGAGGLFTDWRQVCDGWSDMGFPIAVCRADGGFDITRPEGTGGLISPLSLTEQMLYEIGDPADYRLPDVICDFRDVRLDQVAPERVRVTGARGRPAPEAYKVSATWQDGWRLTGTVMIGGLEAADKARHVGQAILDRTARIGARQGLAPFTRTDVEPLGAEASYGPHARCGHTREVVLKLAAAAPEAAILNLLAREIFPAATAMSQGLTGVAGGRPSPSPLIRGGAFLIARDQLTVSVVIEGQTRPVDTAHPGGEASPLPETSAPPSPSSTPGEGTRLIDLAVGRSGDKGDIINVGLAARSDEAFALLCEHLSADQVGAWLAHLGASHVERFVLPGSRSLNFLLQGALNGGGMANLRFDAQGKAVAQMLLDMPLPRTRH